MNTSPRRNSRLRAAFTAVLIAITVVAYSGVAVAADKTVSTRLDPSDPNSVIYLDTAGKLAGTGDPTRPVSAAYKAGMAWHPQALSAEGLAKDRYGLVDWAALVRDAIINPRHSLDPEEEEMPPLEMDVIIMAKGDFVNDVKFPHQMHTYWLSCEACHPDIFIPAAGTNEMSMVGISRGEWCGRCHGKVAFPLTDCNRCHTEKKTATK